MSEEMAQAKETMEQAAEEVEEQLVNEQVMIEVIALALLELFSKRKDADKAKAERMLEGIDDEVKRRVVDRLWRRGFVIKDVAQNGGTYTSEYGEKMLRKALEYRAQGPEDKAGA